MSRIGRKPVPLPKGVTAQIDGDGHRITVKGPKGELSRTLHVDMALALEENGVVVRRPSDETRHKALHGLTRTLVANMVEGVTKGYEKRLEIVGVGYRASLRGQDLEIAAGFSHPVIVQRPEGVEFEVPQPTRITVRGNDKQAVGEIAAKIRKIRPPEPYKGKGIRYEGEHVRKKAGKAAKTSA